MHLSHCSILVLVVSTLLFYGQCITPPSSVTLIGLFPLTGRLAASGAEREAAARVAVENINNDPTILPDTELKMITYNTNTTQSVRFSQKKKKSNALQKKYLYILKNK